MNGEKSKGTMPTITYYYRKYRNFTQFYGVGILWKRTFLQSFGQFFQNIPETVHFHKISKRENHVNYVIILSSFFNTKQLQGYNINRMCFWFKIELKVLGDVVKMIQENSRINCCICLNFYSCFTRRNQKYVLLRVTSTIVEKHLIYVDI